MTYSGLTAYSVATTKYSDRKGNNVERLIIHHTAGGSNEGNVALLSTGARQVSASYCLRNDNKLVGIVPEEKRPWTSGSWDADKNSVTVETVNTTGSPNWEVSDDQLETLAKLAADLCTRYGWGSLDRNRVRGHREFASTACPGPYLWSKLNSIVARANEILKGGTTQSAVDTPAASAPAKKSNDEIAAEVLAGSWGNGSYRKSALEAAGYDYSAIQAIVNQKLGIKSTSSTSTSTATKSTSSTSKITATKSNDTIAREVIAGKWGNGQTRKDKLTAAGYDYNAVQAIVNKLISGVSTSSKKSNEAIAREVIAGKWGNGQTRKDKLKAAGYDYNAVQAIVNKLV